MNMDSFIAFFLKYLAEKYNIKDIKVSEDIILKIFDIKSIIDEGLKLQVEDAVRYYEDNADSINYVRFSVIEDNQDRFLGESRILFIFPHCDFFYFEKAYYHILISCIYNCVDLLTEKIFKENCAYLNKKERDIIMGILNKKNMVQYIAILLAIKPIEDVTGELDL